MYEKAIRTRLLGDATLATLISDRLYPFTAIQGKSLPFVTYQTVGKEFFNHLTALTGLTVGSLQIDIWSLSLDTLLQIEERIRVRLNGFIGTAESVNVQGTILEEASDNHQQLDDGRETALFRRTLTYRVIYVQTV